MTSETRIPLTILTGFLGAGKTTLLNRILRGDHGLRVAVMVNDFGAINIDAQLIVDVAEGAVRLSNGCICCTIRDDLHEATWGLIQQEPTPEYIVVEASGVSDPTAVAHTFLATRLQDHVRLDAIIALVDAEQFPELKDENTVLAMDQVGVADIILLNKVDLVTEAEKQTVRDWLQRMVPDARILETTHSQVPLDLLLGVGAYHPDKLKNRPERDVHVHRPADDAHDHDHDHHHHEHHDHTLVFHTWSYSSERPLSYELLKKAIDQLPKSIFRAKGMIWFDDVPDKRGVFQLVGKRAQIVLEDGWGQQEPYTQIVVIGQADTFSAEQLQQLFDQCLPENKPKRSKLQSALAWIRSAWELESAR